MLSGVVASRCGYCLKASMTHPVDSGLRGNDGVVGLSCCHPLIPVSGTGTGLSPLHQGDLCKTYRHSRVGGNL